MTWNYRFIKDLDSDKSGLAEVYYTKGKPDGWCWASFPLKDNTYTKDDHFEDRDLMIRALGKDELVFKDGKFLGN